MRVLFQRLSESLVTEHFHIHYGWRNPVSGRGLGRDGIRGRQVVLDYAGALEFAYEKMGPHGLNWSVETPEGGRTHVYVFDTLSLPQSPFGFV